MRSVWVVVNAAAGLYAVVFWGYFAIVRLRRREWVRGVANLVMVSAGIIIAVGFYLASEDREAARGYFVAMFYIVPIVLILPVTLHLSQWRAYRRFVWAAEQHEAIQRVAHTEAREETDEIRRQLRED